MPLKLGLGLTKTVGEPPSGSIGASCHIELELDGLLLQRDPAAFQAQVRRAYAACAQAVADELARQQDRTASRHNSPPYPANGRRDDEWPTAAVSPNAADSSPAATERQIAYIRRLAGDMALPAPEATSGPDADADTDRIDVLAVRLYGRPLEELSGSEASRLIDRLRAARRGVLSLDSPDSTSAES